MRLVDWLTCRNGDLETWFDAINGKLTVFFIVRRDYNRHKYQVVIDPTVADALYSRFIFDGKIPEEAIEVEYW